MRSEGGYGLSTTQVTGRVTDIQGITPKESNTAMFASAVSSRNSPAAFAGAYQQVSLETGVASASPHQLVTMLFDGFNAAVTRAIVALRQGQIETKGKAIGHASLILESGLLSTLDLKGGGKLADDLMALYAYVGRRLAHANLRNDLDALDECLRLMEPVRAAWVEIAPSAAAAGARGQ